MWRTVGVLGLGAALGVITGCGIVPRDGQFTCAGDGLCPAGQSCVAGVCRLAPGRDADVPDVPGLDAPGGDAGDAPGTDVPLDVPAGTETCAPGAGRVPADEDLDGRFDEGCPLHFGPLHPVLQAMVVTDPGVGYFGAELTDDGLHLFTVASDGDARELYVATRAAPNLPFDPAQPARMTRIDSHAPVMVTVTGDGSEVFLEMLERGTPDRRIYSSSGEPTAAWTTPVPVTELMTETNADYTQPHVRRDGLEIVYTVVTDGPALYSATRMRRTDPWSAPTLIGPGTFPTLSPDGLTLYFVDDRVVRSITRDDVRGSFVMTDVTDFPLVPRSGIAARPFFSPRTRELFVSLQPDSSGAIPGDGPVANAIFRAEVCRDVPCDPAVVPCVGGAISADGLHCYIDQATTEPHPMGQARCFAESQHLVTIHSAAEATLVRSITTDAWLGISDGAWVTGEPYLYTGGAVFGAGQCAVIGASAFAFANCPDLHRVVCESELWPTFTD